MVSQMVVKAKVTNQARKEENVLGEVAALGIVLAQATVNKAPQTRPIQQQKFNVS